MLLAPYKLEDGPIKTLDNHDLDIHSDFFAAGGTSVEALNLLADIRKQLSQHLPLATLLQNPCVKRFASCIVERHQPLMVNLSENKTGIVVYLAASGHGDAMRLQPLAKALDDKFQLIMLQPPQPEQYDNITQLAQHYATLIQLHQHNQPPLLAGFSIGGISALETARILITRETTTKGLLLIDSTYPGWIIRRTPIWTISAWLVKKLGLEELSINQRTLGSLYDDPGLNGQIAALKHYQAQSFTYPVTLVISQGLKRWYGRFIHPWRKLFGKHLNEQHLPGFHGTLFDPEHVDKLAEVIVNMYKSR